MKLTDRQLSILREVVRRGVAKTTDLKSRMWAISPVLAQLNKKGLVIRAGHGLSRWIYFPNEKGKQVLLDTMLEE